MFQTELNNMSSIQRKRKRPNTAYNFFFAEEHERIREELEAKRDQKEHDEIVKAKAEGRDPPKKKRRKKISPREELGFDRLGKLIGKRWKELSDKDKEKYREMAREDAVRYKEEFERSYQESVSALLQGNDQKPPSAVQTSASSSTHNNNGLSTSSVSSAGPGQCLPPPYNPGGLAAGMPNPSLPPYGAASGMGMIPSLMGQPLVLTPEQQLLQNYLLSLYPNFDSSAAASTDMPPMLPPYGATGMPYAASFGASMYPVPHQQQQQQQQQPSQMTEHERQLAHAERMRNLLIEQGARVEGPPMYTRKPAAKPSESKKRKKDNSDSDEGEEDED